LHPDALAEFGGLGQGSEVEAGCKLLGSGRHWSRSLDIGQGYRRGLGLESREGRKGSMFFSEEKNQKTFIFSAFPSIQAMAGQVGQRQT
jgi:hypothetical protein